MTKQELLNLKNGTDVRGTAIDGVKGDAADSRRYTGQYQIAQSALEQVEIVLVLPRAFAAFPGDRVSLSCGRLGLGGSYEVVSARSRLDEDGERTEIVLSVR